MHLTDSFIVFPVLGFKNSAIFTVFVSCTNLLFPDLYLQHLKHFASFFIKDNTTILSRSNLSTRTFAVVFKFLEIFISKDQLL